MADQKTKNIPPEKTANLIRELTWLVEAAQEHESVSDNVIVGRDLYSDFGKARRAMTRFAQLGLIGAPDEHGLCEINLNNVVALLAHYGETIPPTAGLTRGIWQVTRASDHDQGKDLQICAYDECTQITTTLATIHQTASPGEAVVNARVLAAAPQLMHVIKAYMSDHASCAEDEPGEGCPCPLCEQGRALLAGIYGRQYTPLREE